MKGFKITLNETVHYVRFKIEDRKVTCTLTADENICGTFEGVAKCHPDDKYSVIDGLDRAFDRAVEKYIKTEKRELEKFIAHEMVCLQRNVNGLNYRFKKLLNYEASLQNAKQTQE